MEGGGANMAMEVIEEEMVVGGQPPPPPPLPPPEQQMTRITTCEKHPDVPVIGLCALCLRDRLVDLEVSRSNNNADSSSSATTTASAKLKSIFFRISSSSNNSSSSINQHQQQQQPPPPPQQQHSRQQRQKSSGGPSTLLPQLRRCKSFSAGRLDGSYATPRASTSLEPQRKSCDVRGRNTLWSLFHQDDVNGHQLLPPGTGRGDGKDLDTDRSRNVGFPPAAPVMESKEDEEEEEEEEDEFEDAIGGKDSTRCHSPEEREEEVDADHRSNGAIGFAIDGDDSSKEEVQEGEEKSVAQVEEEEDGGYGTGMKVSTREEGKEAEEEATTSTKKAPSKDLKEIAGSFWLAASVFSKKLRKWRQKQKLKKQHNGNNRKPDNNHHNPHQDYNNIYCSSTTSSSSLSYKLPSSSSSLRQPRGSLDMLLPPSEDLAALGRRSCDVIAPPRFSLDTGRISLDDPWDEPRASWDGYLLSGGGGAGAGRCHNFLNPPNSGVVVQRSDGLIPVEEDHFPNIPGGALQARDYYADFNRRGGGGGGGPRRSLDRSNSMLRRGGPSSEDNINGGGSARVSFELGAAPNDSFHNSSTSLRGDDWSESFDSTTHTGRDPTTTIREEHRTPQPKKLRRRWSKAWNLWGFIHRGGRGNNHGQRNVVGRSMSETWVDHRDGRMLRSSSGLWGRSSFDGNGDGFGNGSKKKKRTRSSGGFVQMERNRRYSQPNNSFESNGMPRFYLPPMRSGGRHGGTRRSVRESLGNPNAFPRSVLQLY